MRKSSNDEQLNFPCYSFSLCEREKVYKLVYSNTGGLMVVVVAAAVCVKIRRINLSLRAYCFRLFFNQKSPPLQVNCVVQAHRLH